MTSRRTWLRDEVIRRADTLARRRGMSRREFLASSMGMAVTLTVINELGCNGSKASSAAAPGASYGDGGFAQPSGPYVVPAEATCNPNAQIPACDEFILDAQTYCFDAGTWRTTNILYPTFLNFDANCTDATNKLDCLNPQHYAQLVFVESDTTMTLLSSLPAAQCFPERSLLGNPPIACGLPLSNEGMRVVRDWINDKAMSERCLNQVQVMPNDFLEHQVERMYAAASDTKWKCVSWKVTPAWTSDTYASPSGQAQAFFLTDPIGLAFIEAGLKLGVPNFSVHKGVAVPGFDPAHNQPWDIGPVARIFPQANFVVYHSAIGAGNSTTPNAGFGPPPEGPYPGYVPSNTPADPTVLSASMLRGVNQLIQSLIDSKVIADPDVGEPFKPHNVYAEMSVAWSSVMTNTTEAQHYVGKILKYLGQNNVLWGTEAILPGSPQPQIEAFRAFQITPQFQELYGYPALTQAMKAQIFGLNAARIYRVDPTLPRCKVSAASFA